MKFYNENYFRRLLKAGLSLVLVLGLCGCGKSDEDNNEPQEKVVQKEETVNYPKIKDGKVSLGNQDCPLKILLIEKTLNKSNEDGRRIVSERAIIFGYYQYDSEEKVLYFNNILSGENINLTNMKSVNVIHFYQADAKELCSLQEASDNQIELKKLQDFLEKYQDPSKDEENNVSFEKNYQFPFGSMNYLNIYDLEEEFEASNAKTR